MSSSLLMTRRFAPLFWTQFFSAFSDNFLKNSLVFLILFHGDRRRGRGSADHARRGHLHRALLFPVGARRRTRRPLRQGGGGAAVEVRGDRHRADRGARVLAAFARIRQGLDLHPVRRAVPVRRDRVAVRPDQVRHSSRPSRPLGAAGRQRAGRGRDLHRHPARHHRGRARRQGRRRSGEIRAR